MTEIYKTLKDILISYIPVRLDSVIIIRVSLVGLTGEDRGIENKTTTSINDSIAIIYLAIVDFCLTKNIYIISLCLFNVYSWRAGTILK